MNESDLKALLRTELNRRLSSNSRYSLRAFARSLKMDPSTLSKIMSGQRSLGLKARNTLLKRMGIESSESVETYLQLSDQKSELMPEWYDTAILEQVTIPRFKATKKSLAQAFALGETQIEAALERLKKLNLIKVSKLGVISDATSGITSNITSAQSSVVKRNLQKQFLQKAMESIDSDPLEDRDMTTVTVAIDPSKIPEAKERIKKFRRELASFLSAGGKTTRTYNVSISLYPLTKDIKEIL